MSNPDSQFGLDVLIHGGWDTNDLLAQLGQAIFSEHPQHGPLVGTPGTDAQDWVHQTTPFTCDVVAQEMILHEFGINVSEAQLTYDAASHGWLTEGGTSPENTAQLLEHYGVHTHTNPSGSLDALTTELAQGHKVIAAVHANDLWQTNWPLSDLFSPHQADHAIVVTGLNMTAPAHPQVVVNDSGDPHGAGKEYPLDQFLGAWRDSGNFFVATDTAPLHLADHPVFGANFHPDATGLGGMYMDSSFWESLLKNLAVTGINYAVQHLNFAHPTTLSPPESSPWESMADAERNSLFLKI